MYMCMHVCACVNNCVCACVCVCVLLCVFKQSVSHIIHEIITIRAANSPVWLQAAHSLIRHMGGWLRLVGYSKL